ncbi:MAG: hypothetical protein RPR91_10880, partial [Colwellia sp.]
MADLGNLGESELERWCHSTDLIVNKSLISDKAGWDHIIDFPYDVGILKDDIHASAYQCKVQVKATEKKNKKVQIKLSNLRRMATDPIPNFILFLEYDKDLQLENAYLRYIDNKLIKRIIERIHTISTRASKQEFKLHTKNMTVKFEPHHLLTSPSGKTFKAKAQEYVGENFQKCVVNKKEYLERVGFDGSPYRMTVTTTGKDSFEKLIDISLGGEGSVEISQLKTFKKRFGQAYDIEEKNELGGRLSIPNIKPAKQGVITFKNHPLKAGFTFDVGLFITPLIKDINHELFSYRLKSKFFEMTARPAKGEMNFQFSLDNIEMEISQYYYAIQFLQQVHAGKTFEISMKFDKFKSYIGKLCFNSEKAALEEELALLKNATSILDNFDIKIPTVINLDTLFKYESSINHLSTIFENKVKGNFKVTFYLVDGELNIDEEVVSVGISSTVIGQHVCSFIFVLIGFAKLNDDKKYEIISKNYIVEEKITYCIDDDVPAEIVKEILLKIEDKYIDE